MKLSRRNFLQTAGMATTVALAQPGMAFATNDESKTKQPEAIAKLKSRKAEAQPITTAEREQRMERARQLMSENKIDAIMVMGGTSLVYFTNIHWWMSERLFAVILPVKGIRFTSVRLLKKTARVSRLPVASEETTPKSALGRKMKAHIKGSPKD
jgi:Xaa-Pro dipeptidase